MTHVLNHPDKSEHAWYIVSTDVKNRSGEFGGDWGHAPPLSVDATRLVAPCAHGLLTHLASAKLSLDLDWNNQSPRMCVAFLPPSAGVIKSKGLTHSASTKLSLDLDWNNQSPRMCVAFLPPSVGVIKSKGLKNIKH